MNEWKKWHIASDGLLDKLSPELKYYWRISNSLLRMSLQENGSPILIGFKPYQGNVWIRDLTTLALAGHFEEAIKGLYSVFSYLKELAFDYFNHNYRNSSFCGLLPELMYSKDRPRGIAMPSYSQSGVIRSILYTLNLFHRT